MKNYKYNYRKPYQKAYRQGAEVCNLNVPDAFELTSEQNRIIDFHKVKTPGRHAIVESGAGVGKTATAKHVVNVSPYAGECAYIVLAKRNQLEAERKIQKANWIIKTTAAFGLLFLRKAWGNLRLSYTLERERLVECCPDIQAEKQVIYLASELVSHAKNMFVGVPTLEEMMKLAGVRDCIPDDKRQALGWTQEKIATLEIQVLNMSLVRSRTSEVSFGDMNWTAVSAGLVRPIFDHLVIDEAQDQSPINKALVSQALRKDGQGTWLGDDNQAIFIFRGAIFDAMKKLKTELPNESFTLSKSFRCGKNIVKQANKLVPDFYAHENNSDGEVIENESEETACAADMPGEDAFLARINAPLMKGCLNFIAKGKPANVEGKDIGRGLLQTIDNIGGKDVNDFVSRLDAYTMAKVAKMTGWNATQKIEKVQDEASVLRTLSETCETISAMEDKIKSLFTDAEDRRKPVIVLSTVHKAKGLEWPRVSLFQDTFKTRATTEEQGKEELNVNYVAWTRAKDRLSFTRP